jgi:hypothetical protein
MAHEKIPTPVILYFKLYSIELNPELNIPSRVRVEYRSDR